MSILCYHAVQGDWRSPLAIDPRLFAAHCAWLARARSVVPLEQAIARLDRRGRLPPRTAALTFDDGFASLATHAAPPLARHGLPATVFLVAETLTARGRVVDWVDTPPPFPLATLTREEVLDLRAQGVRFGSHSWAHRDLTSLTEDECLQDLRDSRELLEDLLGEPVPLLAYPRGRHSAHVRRAASRAGFTAALALPERREPTGPFAVPRAGVYPGNGTAALRMKTSRRYVGARTHPAFPVLRRLGRALGRAGRR